MTPFTLILTTLLLQAVSFAPIFGGAVEPGNNSSTVKDSKLFYVENPYARDKVGLSLCEAKESRNSILSPIDIDLQAIRKGQFNSDLNFTGLDLIPESMVVRNTGYERK